MHQAHAQYALLQQQHQQEQRQQHLQQQQQSSRGVPFDPLELQAVAAMAATAAAAAQRQAAEARRARDEDAHSWPRVRDFQQEQERPVSPITLPVEGAGCQRDAKLGVHPRKPVDGARVRAPLGRLAPRARLEDADALVGGARRDPLAVVVVRHIVHDRARRRVLGARCGGRPRWHRRIDPLCQPSGGRRWNASRGAAAQAA